MKYRIVQFIENKLAATDIPEKDFSAWLAEHGFTVAGSSSSKRKRTELQSQPIIEGLAGPMWDGENIVRYEDWKACHILGS